MGIHWAMLSGGAGSYEAARRTVEKCGLKNTRVIFADTLIECPTLYKFLVQTVAMLQGADPRSNFVLNMANRALELPPLILPNKPGYKERLDERLTFLRALAADVMAASGGFIVWLIEGRNPWQVFKDKRFIGNTMVDPCSKVLKRDLCDAWIDKNCSRTNDKIVLGLDWSETHRIEGAFRRYDTMGFSVEFPLEERPLFDKKGTLAVLVSKGVALPKLYQLDFAHNNCGGFCVKAGKGHFQKLLKELPETFAYHEAEEVDTLQIIDAKTPRGILRESKKNENGETVALPLSEFRRRIETKTIKVDPFDIGGCGCFGQEES